MTYDITGLTGEQAHTIVRALDLYSRLSLGQVGEVGGVIMDMHFNRCHDKITRWDLQELCNKTLKPYLDLEQGEHLGMGHQEQSESGKMAYDIECVIRNKLAKTENHHEHSVWHRTPLHYSQEPLPIIKSYEATVSNTPEQTLDDQDNQH